jgi:membrane associated rhomboid family serine protease
VTLSDTRTGAWCWAGVSLILAWPAIWMNWVPLAQPTDTWPALAQSWVLHPDAGVHQAPWVWWTSAWLHGSAQHLWRNMAGLALLACLGRLYRLRPLASLAWLAAWPLTQVGMLWQPQVLHTYIGMSGVLYAGMAVIAVQQIRFGHTRSHRLLGWALIWGSITRILLENPWQHPLIQTSWSDITVAPWAHLSGGMAGSLLSLLSSCFQAPQHRPKTDM